MKQKIELTFEAFKRWLNPITTLNVYNRDHEEHWQALCAEAEKREPVVVYSVIRGGRRYFFDTEKDARDLGFIGAEVIKLQEVQE